MKSSIVRLKSISLLKKLYKKKFLSELEVENLKLKKQIASLRKTKGRYLLLRERYLLQRERYLLQRERNFALRETFKGLRKRYKEIKNNPCNNYLKACFDFSDFCASCAPEIEYDICFAHNHNALSAAFEFAGRNHADVIFDAVEIPLLQHRSGPFSNKYKEDIRGGKIVELYEKNFIEKCFCVLTVSCGLAEWLHEYYNINPPIVLRNCLEFTNNPLNTDMRQLCRLGEDSVLVLYLGTVYEDQGVEQVMHALQLMPLNFHFATLGNARKSYLEELNALAQKLNVAERVHFMAPVVPGDLVSFASGADIAVVPFQGNSLNTRFSMPNRLFESVMARLPLAVSNLPDLKRTVQGLQNGIIFDQCAPQDIAKKILELNCRRTKNNFKDAIENAARTLTWDNEKKELIDQVRHLAQNRTGGSIAIFANKTINTNNRIYRICKTLLENGYKVTVFSKDAPDQSLKIPDITYFNSAGG
jgi:glycosyltransferase involved in cell wall biosynthesis